MKRMLCSKACMLLTVAALASGVRGAETTLGVPADIMQVSEEQEPGSGSPISHGQRLLQRRKPRTSLFLLISTRNGVVPA